MPRASVFGPAERFLSQPERGYTPPDAPLAEFPNAPPVFQAPVPDDSDLIDALAVWLGDPGALHRVLIVNSELLYGFSDQS